MSEVNNYRMNESHMHVCFRAAQTFCSLSPQAQAVFVTVARSGADCQMDGGKEGDAKRRTGRDSEKDDAAARVDPSKVKKEERSDAGGGPPWHGETAWCRRRR